MNSHPFPKHFLALFLVVTLALAAAGFGAVSVLDAPQQPEDLGPATVSNQTTTPVPPTTTPTEPTAITTVTSTTTSSPLDATLHVTLSDFDDVRTNDGQVVGLVGRLSGSLDWANARVDRADVVVRTWIPGEGWQVARRTTVDASGTGVSLAAAFGGEGFVYATGADARAFSNLEDGTTVVRDGFVAVTATLYADGERVGGARTIESFSFRVTNLAETGDGRPDLVLRGEGSDPTVFAARNAAPDIRGSGSLTVGNGGTDGGVLRITASDLTSAENGHTEPESRVDGDATSELPAALLVRVSLHHDGEVDYVVGGRDRMVAVDALDPEDFAVERSLPAGENATLLVEWYVERTAGNEIQTDSVSFDLSFALVDDDRKMLDG